jgi:hypothetical protein
MYGQMYAHSGMGYRYVGCFLLKATRNIHFSDSCFLTRCSTFILLFFAVVPRGSIPWTLRSMATARAGSSNGSCMPVQQNTHTQHNSHKTWVNHPATTTLYIYYIISTTTVFLFSLTLFHLWYDLLFSRHMRFHFAKEMWVGLVTFLRTKRSRDETARTTSQSSRRIQCFIPCSLSFFMHCCFTVDVGPCSLSISTYPSPLK